MFLARRQPLRAAARVQQNLTLRTATARSFTSATARSTSSFTASSKRRTFATVAANQPKPRTDNYLQNLPKDYFKTPLPDIKKVLVIGSGGLAIGQAGEFDYSGMFVLRYESHDDRGMAY
jgi:carbamoyl-phosphate synthase large subunit